MKTQLDFIKEQKKIDNEYLAMRKELLIFANQKIAEKNISGDEKFRLLTAFVGDFASQYTNNNGHCPVSMALPDKLGLIKFDIETEFDFEKKSEEIRIAQMEADKEFSEWFYAQRGDCVLLPNK